jgi:hypothetical protein
MAAVGMTEERLRAMQERTWEFHARLAGRFPRGRHVVARGKGVRVFPIAPADGAPLAGTTKSDLPVAWESSSRALFVWDRGIPLRVFRVDLLTGQRTLAMEVSPLDPSGVLYGHVRFTPDLAHFLFRFRRHTSCLSVVTGVK